MDFFHSHTKIVKRSKGQSAVACASYRAGLTLYDDRLGVVFNYSGKGGVEYSEIILPTHAPERFRDREALWNEVERKENRKDAQLAREIEFSLPSELQPNEQVIFARQYIRDNFVSQGMIADFSFHSGHHRHSQRSRDDQESLFDTPITPDNPHIHVMLTMRDVTPEGFSLKNTAWNERGNVKLWRENLADRINSEYQKRGISDRVDPRKFSERGIDQEPTIHEGGARELESKGIKTERGEINREIKARNRQREKEREPMNPQRPSPVKLVPTGYQPVEKEPSLWRPGAEPEAARLMREQREKVMGEQLHSDRPSAADLGAQFTELEKQIHQSDIRRQELDYENRQTSARIRELDDRAVIFDRFAAQIRDLQAQKSGLGFFKGWEKAELQDRINKVEQSRRYAAEQLQKEFQITPDKIPDKFREMEEKADDINRQREALPDRQKLIQQQQEIGKQYQKEYPNQPPDKESREQQPPKREADQPQKNLSDQLAEIAAKKRLENMTRENSQGGERSQEKGSNQQNHTTPQSEKSEPSKSRSSGMER